jgi:hypothetical protein
MIMRASVRHLTRPCFFRSFNIFAFNCCLCFFRRSSDQLTEALSSVSETVDLEKEDGRRFFLAPLLELSEGAQQPYLQKLGARSPPDVFALELHIKSSSWWLNISCAIAGGSASFAGASPESGSRHSNDRTYAEQKPLGKNSLRSACSKIRFAAPPKEPPQTLFARPGCLAKE